MIKETLLFCYVYRFQKVQFIQIAAEITQILFRFLQAFRDFWCMNHRT